MRIEILKKRMQRLIDKRDKLTERGLSSEDANEVRSINETVADINN